MNVGGVWKRNGHLSTVIFQFEYDYPYFRNDLDLLFVIDTCVDSVRDYARQHKYDHIFETRRHPTSPNYHNITMRKKDGSIDMNVEWMYWLKDLAEKYDNIIIMDSDVYVVNYDIPFPTNNDRYVVYSSEKSNLFLNGKELTRIESKMFANSAISKFDPQTAIKMYNWFLENRNDDYEMIIDGNNHEGDMAHILIYLLEHPEDFNPILPKEFHWTPHRNTFQDNPVLCHLCVGERKKYEWLCMVLENYT